MTAVPGTYFTEEQLEADRKADNIYVGDRIGSDRMKQIGFVYKNEMKQYNKALAWYILAARENNSKAQNNIGVLYNDGAGVPQNHLCALKWFLKAAEQNESKNAPNHIGKIFESGYGVPLDKHKALEWYCRGGDKIHRDRLKKQGYHRSATDKKKTRQQLIKETEAILDTEKKKLEEKQNKTQQEMEALVDLSSTYKLTGGRKDAWKYVPILLSDDRQRYTQPVNTSVTHKKNEILELKKQIQLLKQDKNTFESQAKQLELQIKERDKELISLRNDNQSLQRGSSTIQHQIKDSKINSLQSENQELKLKIILFQTENQSLKYRIDALEQENKMLEQESPHQRATVQNTGPSNIAPTNSDPSHHNQHDDSYNDLNYETEESDGDDINYDTPSENEDNNNHLSYDDTNELNK